MPEKVRIRGLLDASLPARAQVTLARRRCLPARSWARLEIERLLTTMPASTTRPSWPCPGHVCDDTFTSLLVLENDDMYEQFKVDRGRKDHWASYPAPARIKVVYEPLEAIPVIEEWHQASRSHHPAVLVTRSGAQALRLAAGSAR